MEQYPHADDAEGHDGRDLHEAALAAARKLGKDVTPSARKTYVSLVRRRQFGAIQPSASDRVDLGLVLPGVKARGRLEATTTVGGGRVTHRLALQGTSSPPLPYCVIGVICPDQEPPPPAPGRPTVRRGAPAASFVTMEALNP